MAIVLFNTETKRKEEFHGIDPGSVKMYHCGPTVYDYAHIGNLRSYVFADSLRRMFEWNGFSVTQIINVTDIGHLSSDADEGEDKMTKALIREGKPMTLTAMREVADFYFEKFKDDLKLLNIKTPHNFPFASDHIKEEIDLIQNLKDKGFAYQTKDGLYFDTAKDLHYGKLGQIGGSEEHSRIGVSSEKRNSRDFALWKFNNELGYDAPFGKGFPGWHIECSAMSMKYLGETFDIHTGGIDHIPIHHNNEIAQSENATGKPFAKIWMHNAHLHLHGGKMAKSSGGILKLSDLMKEGYSPLAYRLLLLQTHYRQPMDFSFDALNASEEALYGLYKNLSHFDFGGKINENFKDKFKEAISDDVNTPRAVAVLFEMLKSEIKGEDKLATALYFDNALGLEIKEAVTLMKKDESEIPEEIKILMANREEARKLKDFTKADTLRKQIEDLGYNLIDTETGPKVYKN